MKKTSLKFSPKTDILKSHSLKNTPARRAVLSIFMHDHKPLTAEEIFKKISGKIKKGNIDLVTIYRTLTAFEESGIIKRIDLHSDSQHYELAESVEGSHHHHHLVCTGCGKTEDFELCDVNDIVKKVLKGSAQFRQVSQHSLELFGLCKVCARA